MSHPPELEALPTAGSLVGRHLIVREIAKGTVGPLYLARTQNNNQGTLSAVDTLARVIPLPADLPAKDDQFIAEAIWDSANVGHDMVLRVADVIAGKGWVTLVHDHYVGSLVSSMHRRARELGSGFPSDVAARIALDVLEGLEQSRSLCDANRIPWRAGSMAIGSLYLCGDGRTRALDGQVVAAVMRSAHMRMLCGTSSSVAPEMQYDSYEPDERTDVFAVASVLWELLTGRDIVVELEAPVANVILSVPKGTEVPQGLVYALHRALELEPNRRQSTLRELAVELVMGAEKVATYEQVIEFASTLLPFEAAFQPERSVPPPAPVIEQPMHEEQSPPAWEAQHEVPAPPQVTLGEEPPAHRFASPFDPAPAAAKSAAAALAAPVAAADDLPTVAAPAVAPLETLITAQDEVRAAAAATAIAAAAASPIGVDSAAQSSILDLGGSTKSPRLEQISWPDDEVPPLTAAAKASAAATEPPKKSNGAKVPSQKIPEIGANAAARRESGRPVSGSKAPAATGATKSRPSSSKAVDANIPSGADLVAEVLRKAGKAKVPEVPKKRGLHVSMTTLVLGFSTTVLAVVVVMMVVQHQSASSAPTAPPTVTHAAQPAPDKRAPATAEAAAAQPEAAAAQPEAAAAQRTSAVASAKLADVAATAETKVEPRPKRPGKAGAVAAKSAASGDVGAGDDKGQKKPKTYVPNDL